MIRMATTVIAMLPAPLISLFSGYVCVGRNFSGEGTVGVISRCGFPIWFQETAPGFSMADGWNFARYEINTLVWAVILAIAVQFVWLVRHRRAVPGDGVEGPNFVKPRQSFSIRLRRPKVDGYRKTRQRFSAGRSWR
jgi:hypothetical protein